jgi:hypothetical protein
MSPKQLQELLPSPLVLRLLPQPPLLLLQPLHTLSLILRY